jgi:hypothetical protein
VSGGVFQNLLLTGLVCSQLEAAGQAAVAGARDRIGLLAG